MFETLLVRPVFNLLEFIYAVVPGHDLGIAIILFTVVIRLLMWPLVHRQLHHAKVMRKLQPELKKIKKAAGGDRQKQARLQMELYKERGIKPFASIGTLIIQIPIFIALYQAILKITNDPNSLVNFSYDSVRNLPWIEHLARDISQFDETFIGLVDLARRGFETTPTGLSIYLPAIILAAVSSWVQYRQTKLMMSSNQDARKLSDILKDSAAGKETDQAEVTAAVSRLMLYFLPIATFIFANIVPAALALYLMTTAAVGWYQQKRVFDQDAEEMSEIADEKTTSAEREAALLADAKATKKKKSAKSKKTRTSAKKRRRR